ncbi:MAG: AI-2E family transporter [Acidobacteriota bacterium]
MQQPPKMTTKQITVLVLLGIAGYFLIRMLIPYLTPILWAITLAIFIAPLQQRLNARIRSRNVAAFTGVLITASVVIVPAIVLSIQITHEMAGLFRRLRDGQELDRIVQWFNGGTISIWLEQHLGISAVNLRASLSGSIEQLANQMVGYATGLISNSLLLVINVVMIIFTLFFLLRDGHYFFDKLLRLLPLSGVRKRQLVRRVKDVISATLFGNFLIACVQGGLAGLMFFILGIPAALLWTLVMTVFSLLPFFGSFMIWLPVAIWLLISGQFIKGIVLLLWGTLVVGLVDNILRPMLVSKQVRLHTLAVFYAVLGGLKVFGAIGLVLGPVIVACFFTLLDFIILPGEAINSEGEAAAD